MAESYVSVKEGMPVIRCECGAEILLIPQLEMMGNAIETHIAEHQQKEPDPAKAEAMAKRIQEDLIKQVLEKAAYAHGEK